MTCSVVQQGEELRPRYLLLVFRTSEVGLRCPAVRVEPCRVAHNGQEYGDMECVPEAWCVRGALHGERLASPDIAVYKQVDGHGYACVRPCARICHACGSHVCGKCHHDCAATADQPQDTPASPADAAIHE